FAFGRHDRVDGGGRGGLRRLRWRGRLGRGEEAGQVGDVAQDQRFLQPDGRADAGGGELGDLDLADLFEQRRRGGGRRRLARAGGRDGSQVGGDDDGTGPDRYGPHGVADGADGERHVGGVGGLDDGELPAVV